MLTVWHYLIFLLNLISRCYGNASIQKRLNTEMPQKKAEPLQKPVFWDVSAISARKTEIPQNPVFEGFPLYFEVFPKIFEGFPLFTWQLFLRNIPIFLKTWFSWGVSSFFWGVSAKFLRCFHIFKNLI